MGGSTTSVSCVIDAAPDVVWSVIKRSDTQRYLSRGLIGFWGPLPTLIEQGDRLTTRLALANLVPLWRHHIEVAAVDEASRRIVTEEHGGLTRAWTHRYRVEAAANGACTYTDEIEVDAGAATPVIVGFAAVFCRYRRARLRRLMTRST